MQVCGAMNETSASRTRGYFGIGVERISKAMNAGSIMRSAHAFGASFVFTVGAEYDMDEARADTSRAPLHLPLYHWNTPDDIALPQGCRLVGVELIDEAVDLPSFGHPLQAAYILGPERGALSAEALARCDHVVRIPAAFCINLATAGAIVMYDRMRALGRFARRPAGEGAPVEPLADHVHGAPRKRRRN
jgi:tRNA G18 (ribose-2'-O)-methylase SpoU